jgi:hypothetical protein
VVVAVVRNPPERAALGCEGPEQREAELHAAVGLEGAVGQQAVEAGGHAEGPGDVGDGGHGQRHGAGAREEHGQARRAWAPIMANLTVRALRSAEVMRWRLPRPWPAKQAG